MLKDGYNIKWAQIGNLHNGWYSGLSYRVWFMCTKAPIG